MNKILHKREVNNMEPIVIIHSLKVDGPTVEIDSDPINVRFKREKLVVEALIIYKDKARIVSTFTFPLKETGIEVSFASAEKKIRELLK
jgi:hypothetical protein